MNERVLCVAAHPDDEVLGCGGTLARHAAEGDEVHILFTADGETSRAMKALPNRNFMAHAASKILGATSIDFLDYRDEMLDDAPLFEIVQQIEDRARIIRPSVVYTHHAGDLNLDHALTARAALTAFRPLPDSPVRQIFAFETASSTEWGSGFWPTHFVNISDVDSPLHCIGAKLRALRCYDNEMPDPHPRSYAMVENLAEMRGAACGLWHAEAFMTLRSIR
jgi:LmbE family N-acetylglucosaminyl deacetylase